MKYQPSSTFPEPCHWVPEKGPKKKPFFSLLLSWSQDCCMVFASRPIFSGPMQGQEQPNKICNMTQDLTLWARNPAFKVTGFLVSGHNHSCQPLPLARRWVTQVWTRTWQGNTKPEGLQAESSKKATCWWSLCTNSQPFQRSMGFCCH
jgi:hypothetical protein